MTISLLIDTVRGYKWLTFVCPQGSKLFSTNSTGMKWSCSIPHLTQYHMGRFLGVKLILNVRNFWHQRFPRSNRSI